MSLKANQWVMPARRFRRLELTLWCGEDFPWTNRIRIMDRQNRKICNSYVYRTFFACTIPMLHILTSIFTGLFSRIPDSIDRVWGPQQTTWLSNKPNSSMVQISWDISGRRESTECSWIKMQILIAKRTRNDISLFSSVPWTLYLLIHVGYILDLFRPP